MLLDPLLKKNEHSFHLRTSNFFPINSCMNLVHKFFHSNMPVLRAANSLASTFENILLETNFIFCFDNAMCGLAEIFRSIYKIFFHKRNSHLLQINDEKEPSFALLVFYE